MQTKCTRKKVVATCMAYSDAANICSLGVQVASVTDVNIIHFVG
jgi:hypothetical protein